MCSGFFLTVFVFEKIWMYFYSWWCIMVLGAATFSFFGLCALKTYIYIYIYSVKYSFCLICTMKNHFTLHPSPLKAFKHAGNAWADINRWTKQGISIPAFHSPSTHHAPGLETVVADLTEWSADTKEEGGDRRATCCTACVAVQPVAEAEGGVDGTYVIKLLFPQHLNLSGHAVTSLFSRQKTTVQTYPG